MSDTTASLQRKIASAGDLQSVVRTMKTMAASSLGQYENAVRALEDYYRTVQLGLLACFREDAWQGEPAVLPNAEKNDAGMISALVFGSDQGLVGSFNEVMAEFVVRTLENLPGHKTILTVGERIHASLASTGSLSEAGFMLPNSIHAITPLVGQILIELEARRYRGELAQVYLFYNRPQSAAIYIPTYQRLLPLDEVWRREIATLAWPSSNLPEVMDSASETLPAFIREYLFVSIFRACAESLASENASRLVAMQRAEKNINERLEELKRSFHRLRQSNIDEELFDVVSGFEALTR